MEAALLKYARDLVRPTNEADRGRERERAQNGQPSLVAEEVPDMQVAIKSGMNLLQFRQLNASTSYLLINIYLTNLIYTGEHSHHSRQVTRDCNQRFSTLIPSDRTRSPM